MNLKKGNAYSLIIDNWDIPIIGVVLSTGTKWILLSYNQVDYQFDGKILVNFNHIKDVDRGEDEIFLEKTVKARNFIWKIDESKFDLDSVNPLPIGVEDTKLIIQISFNNEESYIGKPLKFNEIDGLTIRTIDVDGSWSDDDSFQIDEVRTIQIENDYLQALQAINELDYPV